MRIFNTKHKLFGIENVLQNNTLFTQRRCRTRACNHFYILTVFHYFNLLHCSTIAFFFNV